MIDVEKTVESISGLLSGNKNNSVEIMELVRALAKPPDAEPTREPRTPAEEIEVLSHMLGTTVPGDIGRLLVAATQCIDIAAKAWRVPKEDGAKTSINSRENEICPHFHSDRIQLSENNYERISICRCNGKNRLAI